MYAGGPVVFQVEFLTFGCEKASVVTFLDARRSSGQRTIKSN